MDRRSDVPRMLLDDLVDDTPWRKEMAAKDARIAELEAAASKAMKIIDANKFHQWEKIEDASAILREALNR